MVALILFWLCAVEAAVADEALTCSFPPTWSPEAEDGSSAVAFATPSSASCRRGALQRDAVRKSLIQKGAHGTGWLTLAQNAVASPSLQSADLGCLREIFAEEDLDGLVTIGDAQHLLASYCAEDHEPTFCESLARSTFEIWDEEEVAVEAPEEVTRPAGGPAGPRSLLAEAPPPPALCEELRSLKNAEKAFLEGQRSALGLRQRRADDGAGCGGAAGCAADGSVRRKTCNKSCRACHRSHGVWNCSRTDQKHEEARSTSCSCLAEVKPHSQSE